MSAPTAAQLQGSKVWVRTLGAVLTFFDANVTTCTQASRQIARTRRGFKQYVAVLVIDSLRDAGVLQVVGETDDGRKLLAVRR